MTNLIDFIRTIKKGSFGNVLITCTQPKINKSKKDEYGNKIASPYANSVIYKVTRTTNVAIGVSYENTVNSRRENEGKDADFEAIKPFGKSWLVPNLVLVSDKDKEQMYLRTQHYANTKPTSFYIVDGQVVTNKAKIADICSFMPKNGKTSSQGIDNEVVVRDYKFEGVVCLTQGEKEYTNSPILDATTIKNVFKSIMNN